MKYTIVHVNDRAKEQMNHNKKILKSFVYVNDIEFFNGNVGKALDVINHKGIRTDVWSPYDGRSFPPLPGEYGVWVSLINVWDYMIDKKIAKLLVLEDDVMLEKTAEDTISLLIKDLPENWDFLSLYCFEGHNQKNENTAINSEYIHKSINQPSAGQAIIYSNSGAQKLKRLVKRKGIEYTSDCFIFKQSSLGFLNGYSIVPGKAKVLTHDYDKIESLIDPNNLRGVVM
jgi:GR25 family glycosyltransferase involved in LPS biosynthesis